MVWGTKFPPEPSAEAVTAIGDGGEVPARTIVVGGPNIEGPIEDASGRNAWTITGFGIDDQCVLRWRPACNAPPAQWHAPCLSVAHKTTDTTNCQIVIRVYDTAGNLVHTAAVTESAAWAIHEINPADGTILAGTWTVGERFTIEVDVTLDAADVAWIEAPLYPPLGA